MRIYNKHTNFEYALEGDKFEAGISLTGGEAKAVQTGHVDISQATVRVLNGEAYLINANIPTQGVLNANPTRMRKLLLHKSEIVSMYSKMKARKLHIVPVSMYTKHSLIKVGLALGKLKRQFEKRESIKKKDIKRELEKEFKDKF